MLMKKSGEFLKANFGNSFMQSLGNKDLTLAPDDYVIMIDPIWNESVRHDPSEFMKVLIDIYAPEQLDIQPLEHAEGMQTLVASVRHAAISLSPQENRKRYIQDRPDYTNVIRIQDLDLLNCWYGFIYTDNVSLYTLEEEMRPNLKGLQIIYPEMGDSDKIDLCLEANQDHIIILRRFAKKCRYNT